jgi:hypothetical protein
VRLADVVERLKLGTSTVREMVALLVTVPDVPVIFRG